VHSYAAFLRGINVGGRTIKMDKLCQVLQEQGFENVKTLLASGNVVFESKAGDSTARANIEQAIKDAFGFEVHVIVRSAREVLTLVKENPFKAVKMTPNTRLYVTFLSKPPKSKLKLPHTALGGDYKILNVTKGHVISVIALTPKSGTVNAMEILGKEFGIEITTRNWNTIQKVAKLLDMGR
jgi:uncharacterized protein (DUF1697 family)